jgi:hypothetical protein
MRREDASADVESVASSVGVLTEIYVVDSGCCIGVVDGDLEAAEWLHLGVARSELRLVVRHAVEQTLGPITTSPSCRTPCADRGLIVLCGDLSALPESCSVGWDSIGADGFVYEERFEHRVRRAHVEKLKPCENIVMSVFREPQVYIADAMVFGSERARQQYVAYHRECGGLECSCALVKGWKL